MKTFTIETQLMIQRAIIISEESKTPHDDKMSDKHHEPGQSPQVFYIYFSHSTFK